MRPESTHAGHSVGLPALVALILVPLLAVGAFITLGTNANEERVMAAVVNLDQAVELDGQTVPLGRQLAAAMLERDGENISWTLADAKSAKGGLESGEYAAVVTIPREFSAAATSFSENDADTARQATIAVTTSENAPVTDAAVAQEIARLASDTINAQLTQGYLDGIYVGFNQVADQFTTIVDGAGQLSSGAAVLADGTDQASDGANQLADGLMTLSDNSSELVRGGEQLADGATALADGVGELSTGADGLADGASGLANGVSSLSTGASGLADGASQLNTGISGLATGASGLADGASQLNRGVGQLNQQAPALAAGVDQLATGAEPLLGAIPGYTQGTKEALTGVVGLKAGIDTIIEKISPAGGADGEATEGAIDGPGAATPDQSGPGAAATPGVEVGLQQLVAGARDLSTGVSATDQGAQGLLAGINGVDDQLQQFASGEAAEPRESVAVKDQLKDNLAGEAVCPQELDAAGCAVFMQGYNEGSAAGVDGGFTAGFRTGTGTGSAALNTADPTAGVSVNDVATSLAAGTAQLSVGATAFADAVEQLPAQIREGTAEQLGELITGLEQLSTGAGTLITSSQPLVDNADSLGGGATQLLGGINELNTNIAELPAGISQLADGSSQLASGAAELSSGVDQVSTGASGLADGAYQLSSGVTQLSTGATQLSDGASQLADGVGQLRGGAADLAAGVGTYVGGVGQYTGGVDSAAGGAGEFADGIVQLDVGTEQLAEGLGTFSSELAKGADQVPTYSAEAREKLSTVVSNPVAQSDDLIGNGRTALVALVLVAMLWVTSLATFVVARAIPSTVLSSNASNATLWIRTLVVPMLISVVLGAVFGVIGGVALDLPFTRTLGLMAFLLLLGAVFILINHALTAWLGNVGRGISLLLLALSVALGVTSATPGFIETIGAVSPVQNALLLVRTWIAGGSGIATYIGGMLLVAVVAMILSVFAIARRRSMTASQFRDRMATAA